MVELIDATEALLDGELVSRSGSHFTLVDARIEDPRPVQERVPLMVGGNGTRVLSFAAGHADIVGVTGLGRTLDDGHRHEVDWSPSSLARTVEVVRTAAETAGRRPQLEALVQHVEITDDASRAAEAVAAHVPGASVEDVLSTPFVWIGTIAEIAARLVDHRANLGIERYMVRERAIAQAHAVTVSVTR
jgi:alkanesulfonate monooxygenase SsuD/methylene tetrahydromethanopterin reductase-like flavin-dependent oxidoreductase (luciferase family)